MLLSHLNRSDGNITRHVAGVSLRPNKSTRNSRKSYLAKFHRILDDQFPNGVLFCICAVVWLCRYLDGNGRCISIFERKLSNNDRHNGLVRSS